MLLPDFLFHISDRVVELWEQFNVWAIRDICRRIAEADKHMTASAEWQIYKMQQAGMSREAIQKAMQKVLGISEEEVASIFEESAITSYGNDADIYSEAGVQPEPFNTSVARKNLQAYYEQTNGELRNFTQTTAVQSQRIFIDACDEAFQKASSGLVSRTQAIKEAIDKAAAGGLYVQYPSGHRDIVEVAVRRAVMTGVNRASLQMTVDECERQGTNFVIVSSHLGARVSDDNPVANHAGWQGGIYRLKDYQKGFWGVLERFNRFIRRQNYPILEEATGYPNDPLGLGGYNCRHSMYPYIPGITQNHMKQFDPEENRKAYEDSQRQRAMEREMRRTKRIIEGEQAAADTTGNQDLKKELKESLAEHRRIFKGQQAEYREFCQKNGLNPNMERTYVPNSIKNAETNGGNRETKLPNKLKQSARSFFSREETYYDDSKPYKVDIEKYSDEVNETISRACKDVAKAGSESREEYMRMVNLTQNTMTELHTDHLIDEVGAEEIYRQLEAAPNDRFVFVHSHIRATSLSTEDLSIMAYNPQIEAVVAVRTDGIIYYALSNGKHTREYIPLIYEDELSEILAKKYGRPVLSEYREDYDLEKELLLIERILRDFTNGEIVNE